MDDMLRARTGTTYARIHLKKLKAPGKPVPFDSDDKLIECASIAFSCRQHCEDKPEEGMSTESIVKLSVEWTDYMHRCITITTAEQSSVAALINQHRLTRLEREFMIALIMTRLGLFDNDLNNCKDLLAFLKVPRSTFIIALRALSEEGRLFRRGVIMYDDPEEELRERQIIVNPTLVAEVLLGRLGKKQPKRLKNEAELDQMVRAFLAKMENRAQILNRFHPSEQRNLLRANKAIERNYFQLLGELTAHPSWKLSVLVDKQLNLGMGETLILLFLIGRELNPIASADSPSGAQLARAVSNCTEEANCNLSLFSPNSNFAQHELIQPCGGFDTLLDSDDRTLASTEFELSEKAFVMFGLKKGKRKSGKFNVRPAVCSLSQLVLSESVQRSLSMAIAQAQYGDKMIRDWGLGEVIPYGRGVTILFSGPPGTGKTACAEAIARELDRPILIADYSKILNCWVGNTEKNLVRIFREARANNAVLFWDEADAMFYNREMAEHTWEVQDANVILAEIERHEGICILATNRKAALDPALERRIGVKVVFERPDRGQRREIWKRMLPEKLPLAGGLDLDSLAEADLSGGEIKNVVINAVRIAISRSPEGPVLQSDFETAIDQELKGGWTHASRNKIGFTSTEKFQKC